MVPPRAINSAGDAILTGITGPYPSKDVYKRQRLNMLDHIPEVSLPEGHRFVNIEEVYNTMQDYENYDTVVREMQSEISTPEKFLKHCFGVCSVKDHTITGWAMAEYVNLSGCEVGFGVAKEYQETENTAPALIAEFMRMAKDRGLQYVGWSGYKPVSYTHLLSTADQTAKLKAAAEENE